MKIKQNDKFKNSGYKILNNTKGKKRDTKKNKRY